MMGSDCSSNKFLIYPMSPYMLASSRGHWYKLILVLHLSQEAGRYANDDRWVVPGPENSPVIARSLDLDQIWEYPDL